MDDLTKAARDLRAARQRLAVAMQAAAEVARTENANGTPQTVIARELGVNRLTVRSWLGKPPR